MGRKTRSNLPGAFFHITTRMQNGLPPLTANLRSSARTLLLEEAARSDVTLLACCIMPNHLHIVLRQGADPLRKFMQPLLRRLALRVHWQCRSVGHVVERRYRDTHCADVEHLRFAIAYTHLNPVRKKLCANCSDYAWSSHFSYTTEDAAADVASDLGLRLFAPSDNASAVDMRASYSAFLEWRIYRDALEKAAENEAASPPYRRRPCTVGGDRFWGARFTAQGNGATELSCDHDAAPSHRRPDLRDVALGILQHRNAEPADLDFVRSRYGGRRYVELRREIISQATLHGYRGCEIASFLRISPASVSTTLRRHQTTSKRIR